MDRLVVDANVLFSAAIKDGATAGLLLRDDLDLHAPAYLFDEFEGYREMLLDRTHRQPRDFARFIDILERHIQTVPRETYLEHESTARRLSPDPGDVPYFALALQLEAPMWSDDRALSAQSVVPVWTTTDLLESLNP